MSFENDLSENDLFEKKYLKYKIKYLDLKYGGKDFKKKMMVKLNKMSNWIRGKNKKVEGVPDNKNIVPISNEKQDNKDIVPISNEKQDNKNIVEGVPNNKNEDIDG